MSRIVIYQCDRCLKRHSSETMPMLWVGAKVAHDQRQGSEVRRIWCQSCWSDISTPHPEPKEAA